jgi:hypothetical protein
MFNDNMKRRVEELETAVGKAAPIGFFQPAPSLCKRVDKLEQFMYGMVEWKIRVEQQLGVTEITSSQGQKEFLSTKQKPLRGYINEDEGENDI